MTRQSDRLANRLARRILAHHSKSFAFAGRLLPAWCRDDAAAVYAWCRRCDDAVDGPRDAAARATAVAELRVELARIYGAGVESDPVLAAFQEVVQRHAIPRRYPEELVAGMAMDVGAVRYRTLDELLLYCYRVGRHRRSDDGARHGGARSGRRLRRAADLGIAMQLTNICRDVAEDAARDRIYLPAELLESCRRLRDPGGEVGRAVAELLRRADGFYARRDAGLSGAALAVRDRDSGGAPHLRRDRAGDRPARTSTFTRGRAVVSRGRKIWLALRALRRALCGRAAAAIRSRPPREPGASR